MGETDGLPSPAAFIAAVDTGSPNDDPPKIRSTLSTEKVNELIKNGDSLRFNWAAGTDLIPDQKSEDTLSIISESSYIELQPLVDSQKKIKVEIALSDESRLSGSVSGNENGFPIDTIPLNHTLCFGSCFDSGKLRGRYVGNNAEAIMALIEANGDTGTYTGVGVFEKGRNVIAIEGPSPQ